MRRLTAAAVVLLLAAAAPALGQTTDWSVTIEGEHQSPSELPPNPAGESFGQHYDVPDELVGLSCSVVVHTVNNESVHDTDFWIDTDTRVLTVFDIEDGAGQATDSLGTIAPMPDSLAMGFTLRHFNRGMWRTSITVQVTFDCQEPPSTTTTSSTSSSTTVPLTSTSTVPPSSTTTTPPSSSTTHASTTSVPTQPSITPPVVVDTWPELVTTSTPDTQPSTTPARLPHTGISADGAAWFALAALAAGAAIVWLSRHAEDA